MLVQIFQLPLLLSSAWASQTYPPAPSCDPPLISGGDGPLEISMVTVVLLVLAGLVVLALLLRLIQLSRQLQVARSLDLLGYSRFCHSGRYVLKQPSLAVPPPLPPPCQPPPPGPPLPPRPPISLPLPLLCTTPASSQPSLGAEQAAMPTAPDWAVYSRIGPLPPVGQSDRRQTRVFLFEHSAL